jgi:hypothetical protein
VLSASLVVARHARMARSNANALVGGSSREPARHRIDAQETAGVLAALRRVSESGHLDRGGATTPGPAAAPLALRQARWAPQDGDLAQAA